MAHAKYSPSAAYRWLACPGSINACAGIEEKTSEYAHEGTVAHALAELCLTGDTDPWDHVGDSIDVDGESIEVSPDFAPPVRQYVQWIRKIGKDADAIYIERKVAPKLAETSEMMFGTADAIVIEDFGILSVCDLKYGKGVRVEAEGNPQLAAYGLGAYQWLKKEFTIEKLRLSIMQPRINDRATHWIIDDPEAFEAEWSKRLGEGIEATKDPNAPLVTGDHCKFCPGLLTCKAVMDDLISQTIGDFSDDDKDDLDRLLHIYANAGVIRSYLKALDAYLFAEAERGREIPGHKLVRSFGNRSWVLDTDEMIKKLRNKGLKQADFYEMKLRSPTQLEKLIADDKFYKKYVVRPEKGLVLVSEADKREAVKPPALTDFEEGDEDEDIFE